jgi:probable F420-dependent oxidoreductase
MISADVHTAATVSQLFAGLEASAPGRLMVGLGGPQRPPSLQGVHEYLDALDRGQPPVPTDRRLLAALGPRKLALAVDRCAGAIALLVTPAWTTQARHVLGEGPTLVIDQMVVLDPDPQRARATARAPLWFLSTVPGYRANFVRMGFAEAEADGLADRFVDTLVTCADTNVVAQRIDEHLQAGASHVFLTVLADSGQPDTITVARKLAATR